MKAAFALLMLIATGLFSTLGVWQLQRLEWKRELLNQLEQKQTAAPVQAPTTAASKILTSADAYTKVIVQGKYLANANTFVLASTRYGRGFWVLTPLRTSGGDTILINRGFITSQQQTNLPTPQGPVTVQGLLRVTEPHGSLIQANKPAQNRWFSRDVTAIAAHHQLSNTATYFIDADASAPQPPMGGLTVVHFRNNHLQYALTWFGMAILCLTGLAILLRSGTKHPTNPPL